MAVGPWGLALRKRSQACFLQKSTEHMRKVPTITLSITYKGVKFIDASNKVRSPCPAALFLPSRPHPVLPCAGEHLRVFPAGLHRLLTPPGGRGLESLPAAMLKGRDPKPKPAKLDATAPPPQPPPGGRGRRRCQRAALQAPLFSRRSSRSTRSGTFPARPRIPRISAPSPTSPRTCTRATTTATSSARWMWWVVSAHAALAPTAQPRSRRRPLCARGDRSKDSARSGA